MVNWNWNDKVATMELKKENSIIEEGQNVKLSIYKGINVRYVLIAEVEDEWMFLSWCENGSQKMYEALVKLIADNAEEVKIDAQYEGTRGLFNKLNKLGVKVMLTNQKL